MKIFEKRRVVSCAVMLVIACIAVPAAQADDPGKHPFQATVQLSMAKNFTAAHQVNFPTVPAKHRFVIEYVSANIFSVVSDLETIQVFVSAGANLDVVGSPGDGTAALRGVPGLDQNVRSIISQPVRLYADPGTAPIVFAERNGTAPEAIIINVTLSGYLVPLP